MIDVWFELTVSHNGLTLWFFKRVELPALPIVGNVFNPYYEFQLDDPVDFDELEIVKIAFYEQPQIVLCDLETFEWPDDDYADQDDWLRCAKEFFARNGWSTTHPDEEFLRSTFPE